jgi:hypothetical protein
MEEKPAATAVLGNAIVEWLADEALQNPSRPLSTESYANGSAEWAYQFCAVKRLFEYSIRFTTPAH